MKISFANMLGNLCGRIQDCSVDDVTETIALDRRINGKYLRGGTAFGGTCFPRDTLALKSILDKNGLPSFFVDGVNKTNDFQREFLTTLITDKLSDVFYPVVAILGLAFKASTAVTVESTGIALIEDLGKEKNYILKGYDPLAVAVDLPSGLRDKIELFASINEAVSKADLVVVVNSDQMYASLPKVKLLNKAVVIDCWRQYKRADFAGDVNYIALGNKDE